MYHYSARQALIDAKQQHLLTAAARARELRDLRTPRGRWRRATRAAEAGSPRPMDVAAPRPRPCPAEQPV